MKTLHFLSTIAGRSLQADLLSQFEPLSHSPVPWPFSPFHPVVLTTSTACASLSAACYSFQRKLRARNPFRSPSPPFPHPCSPPPAARRRVLMSRRCSRLCHLVFTRSPRLRPVRVLRCSACGICMRLGEENVPRFVCYSSVSRRGAENLWPICRVVTRFEDTSHELLLIYGFETTTRH